MSTLYEINQAIESIIDNVVIDETTGEAFCDFAALDALEMERTEKLENILTAMVNKQNFVASIEAEEKKLSEKKKAVKNQIERMKEYMLQNLREGEKIQSPRFTMRFTNSEAVETDVEFLQWAIDTGRTEFLKYEEPKVSKTELKNALKRGEEVPHASLIKKKSFSVK